MVVVTFLHVFTLLPMDGWMDEKGASFFGFGLVCLTLLKLIMDEKEIDLLFVFVLFHWMKKDLIFV
jgi:hypothetical protein